MPLAAAKASTHALSRSTAPSRVRPWAIWPVTLRASHISPSPPGPGTRYTNPSSFRPLFLRIHESMSSPPGLHLLGGTDKTCFARGDLEDASPGKCQGSRPERTQPEPVGAFVERSATHEGVEYLCTRRGAPGHGPRRSCSSSPDDRGGAQDDEVVPHGLVRHPERTCELGRAPDLAQP